MAVTYAAQAVKPTEKADPGKIQSIDMSRHCDMLWVTKGDSDGNRYNTAR